jgi:glycosyltransferase involved in cell wall biosynthesis
MLILNTTRCAAAGTAVMSGTTVMSEMPGGQALPESKPLLCWVLINTVHYHHARIEAVVARAALRPCVIQMTDTDLFRALDHPDRGSLAYGRHTLFPHTLERDIDRRQVAPRLSRQLTALRPEVVCINGWSSGGCLAALLWCIDNRVPAVIMSDSAAEDEPRRWWKEAIKRRIVRLVSAGLVGGSPHAAYLAELGFPRHRIFSGYDVVDNAHFRSGADAARREAPALRDRLRLPQRYFLASSRFVPKKNLPRLLQAYAAYRRNAGPAARALVILGDGNLRPMLERLRHALGLDDAVMLPGFKDYDDLPAFYGLADAFIHASTTEQWGLVVNEAMAAGLPIVLSERCGCAPELVRHGCNGFTFDPYDVDALAKLMLEMASDGCDRVAMGQASRAIIARWSPETFADNLAKAAATAMAAPLPTASKLDHILLRMLRHR